MAALGWLPLLVLFHASALQPAQPSPTIELCRNDVIPCQSEVNIAPGEEVTLALFVRAPESASDRPVRILVGWHLRLKVEGNEVVDFPDGETMGAPFREQMSLHAKLVGMNPLDSGPQRSASTTNYYRIRNSYSERDRQLDYAVIIVGSETGLDPQSQLELAAGDEALLGTLTLRGSGPGTARLVADFTTPMPSKLVVINSSGELNVIELAAQETLARLNVGPDAEEVRLEGQIWSDVPAGEGSQQPYTSPFRLEVWKRGAVPRWQGGTDLPLVTFNNVQADNNGYFAISDIPTQFVTGGTYDLRAIGSGRLPHLLRNVQIKSSDHQGGNRPQVVSVIVGPLSSGDLNGDNLVNENDLIELMSSFGREVRDLKVGLLADLNNDGVVDGQDFSLIAANYGRRGE